MGFAYNYLAAKLNNIGRVSGHTHPNCGDIGFISEQPFHRCEQDDVVQGLETGAQSIAGEHSGFL